MNRKDQIQDGQKTAKNQESIFEHAVEEMESDIPRDYMLNHMVCDFAESVRWWMNHEEYSPEEISGFYLASTPDLVGVKMP